MRLFHQIFKRFKDILFGISNQSENLSRIENKLDNLNQKVNDLELDSIYKKLNILSQQYNEKNNDNIKDEKSAVFGTTTLVSKIEELFENQFLQIESLLSIYRTLPNLKFLPTTRGWAGSPDFLSKIMNIILKEKPQFVLEASSGVSSVIIGLTIKLNNCGKAISLEHESRYLNFTQEYFEINQINNTSNVEYCPLRNYNIFGEIWKWYDIDNLNFTEKIDILIIDGPPRTTQFLARYPAVPLLYKYFSQKTLILLDDANRSDEAIIVQKWINFLENNNFKVMVTQFDNFEKGMIILEVCRL